MSATTLALSLPEIVTRVFVHLAEPSSWVASTVNVLWWQSAQHAALLTRARVCSDPDAVGVHLLDALLSGPKEAGESVRHLSLSTGIEPDAINTPLFQPLGQFAAFMARKTLERCRNVTSVAVHGRFQPRVENWWRCLSSEQRLTWYVGATQGSTTARQARS